jgi:CheY-like chemotaxis protein
MRKKKMVDNCIFENINVLLVEDDEVDVEAVKREFKKRGIKNPLYHAVCGVDALEILRGENQKQKLGHPYVILLDINMPKMNGLEFLREIRKDKSLKESIAFILTTSSRDSDIAAAQALNAAGYFLKDDMRSLMGIFSVYRQINKFSEIYGRHE